MNEPTFDRNGYPTEATLAAVRTWPVEDLAGLFRYIFKAWEYAEYSTFDGVKLELHTAGWSGNESLLAALCKNELVWAVSWLKSERGGHYEFEVPKYQREKEESP